MGLSCDRRWVQMNSDRRGGREGPNNPWDKDTRTMTLPLVTYLPECQESLPGKK